MKHQNGPDLQGTQINGVTLRVHSNILHVWFGVCFAGDQIRIIGEMSTGTNHVLLVSTMESFTRKAE